MKVRFHVLPISFVAFVAAMSFFSLSFAAVRPGAKDKCPVCGMFSYKYQDFLGSIELMSGQRLWFDGAKDLFKYYINPKDYGSTSNVHDFKSLEVTDYYSLQLIDARIAWYVLGSDVYGPMGHELIPFASEADAKEFMKDHSGKHLLRFQQIQLETVQGLD